MAAARIIEHDSGIYRARQEHPHNGYYAGDFSDVPFRPMAPLLTWSGSPTAEEIT